MKNYLIYFVAFFIIGMVSCTKDEPKEEIPGDIPGMGEAPGDLQVKSEFALPEGISFVGDIKGIEVSQANIENNPLKSVGQFSSIILGSGGQWVALELLFANTSTVDKDILIPAGCVFEAQQSGFQHAINLQEVRIHILGNSQLQVKIFLYCINKGRGGSTAQVTYIIRGVTTSHWMAKLYLALQYKKIDISNFTENELEDYNQIVGRIQLIVWAITNGTGVNQADWDFINGLKDIINNN